MRAVVWSAYGEMPVLGELPDPVCPDDGVVVRVGATGVCRSDWHAWLGHDPVPFLPWVPGHELAGTVAVVGRDVTRWTVGDRVTVPFACGCGRCEQCAAGDTQVCPDQTQPGFTHHGSFADLVALHAADTNLVRLPDDLSFVDAASLGCRFATAYRAVVHQGRTTEGDVLAVHGCGGVGLSAVVVGASVGRAWSPSTCRPRRSRRRARSVRPPRSTRRASRPPRSRPRCATPRAVVRTCRWTRSAAPPP